MCRRPASSRTGIATCGGSLSGRIAWVGYGSNELAIIAVGLAVQLVEHVCHCWRQLVWLLVCRARRKGVSLMVGNVAAACALLTCGEAECQTQMCLSGAYSWWWGW